MMLDLFLYGELSALSTQLDVGMFPNTVRPNEKVFTKTNRLPLGLATSFRDYFKMFEATSSHQKTMFRPVD